MRRLGPRTAVGLFAGLVSFAWSWQPSLWTDEAATITAARMSPAELWRLLHTIDAVHGLYYSFMHVWVGAFGSSALALRLPSAIAVGLATAGLFELVRRIGGPDRVAAVIAVTFALLPRTTWMGAEGRGYAATAAVAVLLGLLAVRALAAEAEMRDGARPVPGSRPVRVASLRWVGYALVAAVGIVLNLYLALLLVAHGVTVLLLRPGLRATARFATAGVGAVAAASPFVLAAAGQSGQLGEQTLSPARLVRNVVVNQAFLGDTPTPGNAPSTSLALTGGPADLWQPAAVLLALLALAAVLHLLIRAAAATRRREPTDPDRPDPKPLLAWALPWALLPGLLVGAYAMTGPPLYNPRYFSFTAPAVAILLGLGILALRGRVVAAIVVTGLIGLTVPVYLSQRQASAKSGTDWAQAAAFVAAHRGGDDAVYFAPRYQETGPVVTRTLRSIRVAYPADFGDLRDLTETATPAATGTLTGTSARLQAAGPRLAGRSAVWVLRRNDYPPDAAAADEAFLRAAGFVPVLGWHGPLTTVQEFRRR